MVYYVSKAVCACVFKGLGDLCHLSDFNRNRNVSTNFHKKPTYKNCAKIFRAGGRTERRDEADSYFSQLL
jgi:hypothetical protein